MSENECTRDCHGLCECGYHHSENCHCTKESIPIVTDADYDNLFDNLDDWD